MAATPRRGATAPETGTYKRPAQNGTVDTERQGQYRNSPTNQHDYVPYGNVYERQGVFEIDRRPTGGVFEQYTEEAPTFTDPAILSWAYPPLIVDDMHLDLRLTSGNLNQVPSDSMSASLSLLSGTLSSVLLTYSIPPEDLDVDLTLTSGTLVVALLTYNMLSEDLDVDLTLLSGTIEAALITYSNWLVESLDVDLTLTGGTLA
jgi:hypothetical protein